MFSTVERSKFVARRFGKGQLGGPPIANKIESTLNDAAGQGCDWYCEQGECIPENGCSKMNIYFKIWCSVTNLYHTEQIIRSYRKS